MNIHYTQEEKVAICADIATQLKEFQNAKGEKVNLFNEEYSFVPTLKKLFQEYIQGNNYYKGSLEFVEIGKRIDYHLPLTKKHTPLFVIRVK
jgi:hypothetical protein